MNILITSAGRRVRLLKEFKSLLLKRSSTSLVMATDLNPKFSPAAHFADKSFTVGSFKDKSYIDKLEEICLNNNISIVIPTIDTELELLSINRDRFLKKNIQIIVSDYELIKTFGDKSLTANFYTKLKIKTPKIYGPKNLSFPTFIKPRYGSNSKGIYLAKNDDDIPSSHKHNSGLMFMQYINPEKYDEYTVDSYFDKNSNLICAVPRIRLKVVGGESNQGITKKNYLLEFIKSKFKNFKGARGTITMQFFVSKKDQTDIYGLEINPRFGGGYPFALNAGANFPLYVIQEYLENSQIEYNEEWKANYINLRFEKEVSFEL